ncbi:MAG TPA: hypothetical protein VKE51_13335 [Vicinamibacterales bacterium]|nr:hypothetical protein [Vicinamibacterales bacterium]
MLFAAIATGCGPRAPANPSRSAVVTFQVVNESFRVQLTTDAAIDAAMKAQAGGAAKIPNGRVVAGAEVNAGWSWHLVDVEFAEAAIELCDGRPSDVERAGTTFGGGRYCPWSARITSIVAP